MHNTVYLNLQYMYELSLIQLNFWPLYNYLFIISDLEKLPIKNIILACSYM